MESNGAGRVRVLICGSRTWNKPIPIDVIVGGFASVYGPNNITIIEGQQRGADAMAASAALRHGVGHEPYPADWDRYGRAAGAIRNQAMLDAKPDLVVAFCDDLSISKGTANMVSIAKAAGVPVYVVGRA